MNDYQDFRPPLAPLEDAPDAPLELAGRGSRLGAKCVDGLTVLGVMLVTGIAAAIFLPLLQPYGRARVQPATAFPAAALVAALLVFLAFAGLILWNCLWLHRYGQTVGKRVLRIRIVRSDGGRCGLGRIFALRYLPMMVLGLIPVVGFLVTLTDWLLIFRDSRKCLHDQFADTIVVKTE